MNPNTERKMRELQRAGWAKLRGGEWKGRRAAKDIVPAFVRQRPSALLDRP